MFLPNMPPEIYNDSIKHFLCCLIKGGSTLSPVIIDKARLIDIPEMSDAQTGPSSGIGKT
jgi:hypothetical protein